MIEVKHDTLLHIAAGGFGIEAPGCAACGTPYQPHPDHPCSTDGCPGDGRYAAPGRGHIAGCAHPLQDILREGVFDRDSRSWIIRVTDEWVVSVAEMIFNHRINLTTRQNWEAKLAHSAGWCYDNREAAFLAAEVFDPATQQAPVGYKKIAHDFRVDLVPCGSCSRQAYDGPPQCGERWCPGERDE